MTIPTLRVLKHFLTDTDGDHYGYEICKGSKLPSGTIYPILTRLEKAGWISGHWEEIDESKEQRRKRRYYKLTGSGERGARAALEEQRKLLFPDPVPA